MKNEKTKMRKNDKKRGKKSIKEEKKHIIV